MGQLFGQGGIPDVLIRPVIGFGMPPSGEYDNNPATDGSLGEDAFGYSGGSPGEDSDSPAQPIAPPSGQKQYTFKNPDGTTYQHSLYKEPAQPIAPQQPTPDTDAEDHGAPGIVDDGGIEKMPGPDFDLKKLFGQGIGGKVGPAIDPSKFITTMDRPFQYDSNMMSPSKINAGATPTTLPQQPTQTQQPSWFAQTTDAQSPLLNTVGIWR